MIGRITAGNDAAGAGSGEMSALSMGSAGVMERTAVTKGGRAGEPTHLLLGQRRQANGQELEIERTDKSGRARAS